MAKATPQHIIAAGFRANQFGLGGGWESDVLPELLTTAERWARQAVGDAAYTAAASDAATLPLQVAFDAIRDAEIAHVSATLWRRRAAFLDSNAISGQEFSGYLDRREMFEHARTAEADALRHLQRAGTALGIGLDVDIDGSAIAVGHVEHGAFAATSVTAVTA